MGWEAVAALAIGIAALAWILEPMVRPEPESRDLLDPPEPEETPKGVALAALREIEFDRATGKLSDADYAALLAKYSAAAIVVLKNAEAMEPAEVVGVANDIEAAIAARVRQIRLRETASPPATAATLPAVTAPAPPVCPRCGPRPEADALFCSACGVRILSRSACSRCGTALRPDSRFCEECGTGVAA